MRKPQTYNTSRKSTQYLGLSDTFDLFRQRKKDLEWYKRIDSYFRLDIHNDADKKYAALYGMFNSNIDDWLNVAKERCGEDGFTAILSRKDNFEGYNILPQKVAALSSDYMQYPLPLKVIILSAGLLKEKDAALKQEIQAAIDNEIAIQLSMMDVSNADPKKVEEYVASQRELLIPKDLDYKSFATETEVFYASIVKHISFKNKINDLKEELLQDLIISGRHVCYVYEEAGQVSIEPCSPIGLRVYKSNSVKNIHEADAVRRVKNISFIAAIQKYPDLLDTDDMDDILSGSNFVGGDHNVIIHALTDKPVFEDIGIGGNYNSEESSTLLSNIFLKEEHLEFKAYRDIMFLTFKSELGEEETITIDRTTDIIPRNAIKTVGNNKFDRKVTIYEWEESGIYFKAELDFIPRRYHLFKIGSKIVRYEEVPWQPDRLANPYLDFTLSYFGRDFAGRNAAPISPMQRAVPYALQHAMVKYLQDIEIERFRAKERMIDVARIPTEFVEHNGAEPKDHVRTQEEIANMSGNWYYDNKKSNGLIQNTNGSPIQTQVTDTSTAILNLNTLADTISMSCGLSMGVPPQKEAMFDRYVTQGDNQQAMTQSTALARQFFRIVDSTISEAVNQMMNMEAQIIKRKLDSGMNEEEVNIEYGTNEGTKELIRVSRSYFDGDKAMGIYLDHSPKDDIYFSQIQGMMANLANGNGQGADIMNEILLAVTRGETSEEVANKIRVATKTIKEEMSAAKQAEYQQQIELQKMRIEEARIASEARVRERMEVEYEISKRNLAAAELNAQALARANDINENEVNDYIEGRKMDIELKEKQLEFERFKFLTELKFKYAQ